MKLFLKRNNQERAQLSSAGLGIRFYATTFYLPIGAQELFSSKVDNHDILYSLATVKSATKTICNMKRKSDKKYQDY